jgi:hypothetical protein
MPRLSYASGALLSGLLLCLGAARADDPSSVVPPGFTMAHTGGMHDFDYFEGAWTTRQHKLKARGVGSHEWEEFPATLCMRRYLNNLATIDELYMPGKDQAGLTVRLFNTATHQWSIYWASTSSGKLEEPPMVGGFAGERGEFYSEDEENHRPIKVRFLWTKVDHDHARWEQAFSYDNRTWETNWSADFTRANAAQLCDNGRPKRKPG